MNQKDHYNAGIEPCCAVRCASASPRISEKKLSVSTPIAMAAKIQGVNEEELEIELLDRENIPIPDANQKMLEDDLLDTDGSSDPKYTQRSASILAPRK